jgi:phage gpG-like protein
VLKIRVIGDDVVAERFRRMPDGIRRALLAKVFTLTLLLEAHVKNDKLSGQVLNTRSGRLKRSIQGSVEDNGDIITGSVFSSGDVPYAAIQEFGGTTSPHDIVPVKAKALSFMMHGKQVFAKIVHHPGSKIPERSYLRSALSDMKQQIVTELEQATREAVRR